MIFSIVELQYIMNKNFAEKYGKGRSYIYFWLKQYDGTLESLACPARRPKKLSSFPVQYVFSVH